MFTVEQTTTSASELFLLIVSLGVSHLSNRWKWPDLVGYEYSSQDRRRPGIS